MSRLSLIYSRLSGHFCALQHLRTLKKRFAFHRSLTVFSRQLAASAIRASYHPLHGASRAELINAESELGGQIFGPIPAGHRREFFHDQRNVWIWYEDWASSTGEPRKITVRYEIQRSGVYKKVSAGSYFRLEGFELENFRRATHAYLRLIKDRLYSAPAHC